MKYRKGPRFGLSEKQQSLIYWQCVNYDALPFPVQHRILNLCTEIGGEYHAALFRAVTTTQSVTSITYTSFDMPMDESTLARFIKKFYVAYNREKIYERQ